jgi:hypothetical protein
MNGQTDTRAQLMVGIGAAIFSAIQKITAGQPTARVVIGAAHDILDVAGHDHRFDANNPIRAAIADAAAADSQQHQAGTDAPLPDAIDRRVPGEYIAPDTLRDTTGDAERNAGAIRAQEEGREAFNLDGGRIQEQDPADGGRVQDQDPADGGRQQQQGGADDASQQ